MSTCTATRPASRSTNPAKPEATNWKVLVEGLTELQALTLANSMMIVVGVRAEALKGS